MSIQMTAKKACRYGSRQVQAGEDFTVAGQSDARLYHVLGWAAVKETPVAKPVAPLVPVAPPNLASYTPKVMEAAGTALEAPAKRRYQRRDMTAQDPKSDD